MRLFIITACLAGLFIPAMAKAATVPVVIDNYAFSPKTVVVHPGDSVVWTNKDSVPHTVKALDGAFDSATIDPGKMYRFTFAKVGDHAYRCGIHPEMRATVTVKP